MMDFFWEGIFSDFFYFRHDFFRRILPQKNVVFFYLSYFGGCEDDLYISTQQIDGTPNDDF